MSSSSPSLPELPSLAGLQRCPSHPAPPPGALPRHVAPPAAGSGLGCGDACAEAVHHPRILHQSESLGRLDRASTHGGGHLVFVSQHELLPPLRPVSLLQSRGSARLQPSPKSSTLSRRTDVDFFYDSLGSRASTRGIAGRSALVGQLDAPWHDTQDDLRHVALPEVETLKRQVSRLSQHRRDRDSYIQDLLADAEATKLRHDGEHTRRAKREHKEVGEQLIFLQRDHELYLEELGKIHAAALAQQAAQHEAELTELRNSLCSEAERRLEKRVFLNTRLKQRALAGQRSELCHWRQCVLHAWKGLAARSRGGTSSGGAARHAEVDPLEQLTRRMEAARAQRRVQGLAKIGMEAACVQQIALSAWAAASTALVREREHQRLMDEKTVALAQRLRSQLYLTLQASLGHAKHAVLRAWAAYAGEAMRIAAVEQQLVSSVADAEERLEQLREVACSRERSLSDMLRTRTYGIVRAQCARKLSVALMMWAEVSRDRRREAGSRLKLLTAAADSASELYRLRNETKKVTTELRRQRRAHGVAAIHASLDRRLQAVVHAWSTVSRDAQRESIYQRQLDIAAAEAAAGCAVLRMEGRRTALELRHQRRTQALRAVRVGLRHWRHVVLYAWSCIVLDGRRESAHAQLLGRAALQVEACGGLEGRLRAAQGLASLLAAWRCWAARAVHVREAVETVSRYGRVAVDDAPALCALMLRTWRAVAVKAQLEHFRAEASAKANAACSMHA